MAIGGFIRGHLALCFCFGVAHGITGNPRRREAYGQVTQSVRWVRLGTCRIGYGLGQFWVTRVLGLASVVS